MTLRRPFYIDAVRAAAITALVLAAAAGAVLATRTPGPNSLAIARAFLAVSYSGPYTAAGPYPGPPTWLHRPGVRIVNGLPVEPAPLSGRDEANPAIIAQYGLWAYGRYLSTSAQPARDTVLRAAQWLVRQQTGDGRWIYHFVDTYPGGSLGNLDPPWSSALAQGQAMSLLERAFRITRRRVYLSAAVRALQPLERAVAAGGLRRCFRGDCVLPFFEEAPTRQPSLILNGFMFTLIGLYDLSTVASQSAATSLYAAGRRTLHSALPDYDEGGLATYDLLTGRLANAKYQAIQIYLLRALNSLDHDPRLTFYAHRWRSHIGAAPAQ